MERDCLNTDFLLSCKSKQDINVTCIEMENMSVNHVAHSKSIVEDLFINKNEGTQKGDVEKDTQCILPLLAGENSIEEDEDKMKPNYESIYETAINSKITLYNTELFKCVEKDLAESAKRNLDLGANPNATCHLQRISICHMAAYFGSDRVLQLVLQRGANPFRRDYLGRTPLHFAAWRGQSTSLLILLNHTFNSAEEKTAFLEAAEGTPDIPDPIWMDSSDLHNCLRTTLTVRGVMCNKTALQLALSQLNLECAHHLLKAGARICSCNVMADQVDASFCASSMGMCGSALKEKDLEVDERFLEAIKMLKDYGKKQNIIRKRALCQEYYKLRGKKRTALHNTAQLENGKATRILPPPSFNYQHLDLFDVVLIQYAVTYEKITPLQHLMEVSVVNMDILQFALKFTIIKNWMEGVSLILNTIKKINANIDRKDAEGNTVLHYASRVGNQAIVKELIKTFRSQFLSIDVTNCAGYTPLHEAVNEGTASCVRELLYQGAAFQIDLQDGSNILHVAAKKGHHMVLKEILEITKLFNQSAEFISKKDNTGLSPLHWASYANNYKCFELLFNAGANLYTLGSEGEYYGFTVLHIAAINNSTNVVRLICRLNESMMNSGDHDELTPFHRAILNGHRETSTYFLMKGANLSDEINVHGKKQSILEIIAKNWQYPKNYLKELFNMHMIKNEYNLDDPRCVVNLNYSLFIPKTPQGSPRRMKVFEKLFNGDLGFNELLMHPLVESFLHLEWKRLRYFFFGIVAVYALLLFFITCLIIDIYDNNKYSIIWEIFTWINIIFIILMECLLISESKSAKYLGEIECVSKAISVLFVLLVLVDCRANGNPSGEFSRALASLTILAAWTQLGIQISRLIGGLYFQMFTRVAAKVAKVMILFGCFPIIGFALAFWVLFRGKTPFDTWMDSIVKTIVMMTSEFDYANLFEDKPFDLFWITTRLIFLAYIVSVSIILINLLMALAISETKDLKAKGRTQQLLEQVHFLGTLDSFAFNIVRRILPRFISMRISKEQFRRLQLCPGRTGTQKSKNSISENLSTKIFESLPKQNCNQIIVSSDLETNDIMEKKSYKEHLQVSSVQWDSLNKRLDNIMELLKKMQQ